MSHPFLRTLPALLFLTVLFACGCNTDLVTGEPVSTPADTTAASPAPASTTNEFSNQARSALALVNEIRAEGCTCGNQQFPPASPLRLDARLMDAARRHSADMAAAGKLQHQGTDGSGVGDRVSAAGYRWRAVAENIAWNQRSVAQVVQAWKDSPGHCRNLMGDGYTLMGFSEENRYWTQVFAQ